MAGIKDRIEFFFEQLARVLYTHRFKTLLLLFLFVGAVFYKLPALTVDTNSEALLKDDDPKKIIYNAFRDQFGQDRMIVVAITADNIFSEKSLKKLKRFHYALKDRVPHVDEITSLINARNTRGEENRLIVEDLLEGWPEERQIDFDWLKNEVMNNPAFINHIISADARTTAVVIKPDVYHTQEAGTLEALDNFGEDTFVHEAEGAEKPHYLSEQENEELVQAVEVVINDFEGPDFSMAYAGAPAVMCVFNNYTMKDLRRCFLLSFLVALVFLAVLFRRASGVILPQIVVNAASFSALGLMGWTGVPIKMTTTVLPAFLLCVGVADSVHILSIFYKQIDHGDTKEDAIAYAMGHSGLAVGLTTMTTAAALLSFSFAQLTAMGELGLFAAAGVTLALLYTVVMLPPLVALVPVKSKSRKTEKDTTLMDRILLRIAGFGIRYPLRIIAVSLILFAVCYHFLFNLRYSDHVVNYFPESLQIRQDLDYIDQHLNGALNIEVIIDTGEENGVYDPAILNRIKMMTRYLQGTSFDHIDVGDVTTINNILKETHQALHANNPRYYVIPQDYNTIAQEFFLFENSGSDDLESIVDTQFSKTRASLKVHWVDSVYLAAFIEKLEHYLNVLFKDKAEIAVTGMSSLMARTISAALDSMTKSYILAFVVIAFMMILLVGEVKTGLYSMIPNMLPIILTLGIMGAADIPLDLTSLMIASIAMGLVVDDTVHFIYNFRKYYLKTGSAETAINMTLTGVGRALLITSIVLSCGFFVTVFATLSHTIRFGIFTGITIIFALLADFILAPALMIVITDSYKKTGNNRETED